MKAQKTTLLASTALLAVLSTCAHAATLKVPRDYPTIGDAVSASGPGDLVLVAAGDYRESVRIDRKQDLMIRGKGRVRLINAGTHAMIVNRSQGIRIRNLIIEGERGIGVSAALSTDVEVKNCTLLNCAPYALSASSDNLAITFKKNRISDTEGTAIYLTARSSIAAQNRIERCTRKGILVGGAHNTVAHNRISRVDEQGLLVLTEYSLVHDNTIQEPGLNGLHIEAEDTAFLDNSVKGSGSTGIRVRNTDSCEFSGNRISGAGGSGISLVANSSVLGQSRISNTRGGTGLVLGGSGNLVSGNSVKGSANHGMDVGCEQSTVSSNKMRRSGGFDLHVSDPDNELLQNRFRTSNL